MQNVACKTLPGPELEKGPQHRSARPPPPKILKAPLEFFKGEGPLLALESTNLYSLYLNFHLSRIFLKLAHFCVCLYS